MREESALLWRYVWSLHCKDTHILSNTSKHHSDHLYSTQSVGRRAKLPDYTLRVFESPENEPAEKETKEKSKG